MATCDVCSQEMTQATTCLPWRIAVGGRPLALMRYGDEPLPVYDDYGDYDDYDDPLGEEDDADDADDDASWRREPPEPLQAEPWPARCGDCGVSLGGWHHPGCDLQVCPRCGGQLISCGCWDGRVVLAEAS